MTVLAIAALAGIAAGTSGLQIAHVALLCPEDNDLFGPAAIIWDWKYSAIWLVLVMIGLFQIRRQGFTAFDVWRGFSMVPTTILVLCCAEATSRSLEGFCDTSYWKDFDNLRWLLLFIAVYPLIFAGVLGMPITFAWQRWKRRIGT